MGYGLYGTRAYKHITRIAVRQPWSAVSALLGLTSIIMTYTRLCRSEFLKLVKTDSQQR